MIEQGIDMRNVPEPIFVLLKSLPPGGTTMSTARQAALCAALKALIDFYYGEDE